MTEVNMFADISHLRNANETQIVYSKLTVVVAIQSIGNMFKLNK